MTDRLLRKAADIDVFDPLALDCKRFNRCRCTSVQLQYSISNYAAVICAYHVLEAEDRCEMLDTAVDIDLVGQSDMSAVIAVLMSDSRGGL